MIATLGLALFVASATCDPPGPPPRFGCQWSVTDCDWVCAVCDPFGSPPRLSCHWDSEVCNWICPGYTGVDVTVQTLHAPTTDGTVYVRLSSLCTATGAAAVCGGSFAVYARMPLSEKCNAIADAVATNCSAAGYAVSANDCASAASFTASNVGCPPTQFALGVSDDPGVFDQTEAGALPDGEVESICARPTAASNLRLEKVDGGTGLRSTWDDAANADGYLVFEDEAPGGSFTSLVGTAQSGSSGLALAMPSGSEFFLVAGSNSACGVGPKK